MELAQTRAGRNGGRLKSGNYGPQRKTAIIPIVRDILAKEWEVGKPISMPNGEEVICNSYENAIAAMLVVLATMGNEKALEWIMKLAFNDDQRLQMHEEKEQEKKIAESSTSMFAALTDAELWAMLNEPDEEFDEVIDEAV